MYMYMGHSDLKFICNTLYDVIIPLDELFCHIHVSYNKHFLILTEGTWYKNCYGIKNGRR